MSDVDPSSLVEPAATRVRDPISGRSVWLAQMVRNPRVKEGVLLLDIAFAAEHADKDRRGIKGALKENLKGLGWQGDIAFNELAVQAPPAPPAPPATEARKEPPVAGMGNVGGVQPHGGPVQKQQIEGVKHVVVVSSAKGGVGKSTVAVNLAVALSRAGFKTGLLDSDIYGPSLPRMMNCSQRPLVDDEQRILPPSSYGVKCLSVGQLVPDQEAIIWRGPMIMNLIRQFLQVARWGDLDYLVVDMPPGTGDAQLTLIQGCDIAGAIIVTTPQEVALADAVRGITMFNKLEVPVLGLVENMAWYELPDGSRDFIFGRDGGKKLAMRFDIEVIGQIPLQTTLRQSGDDGLPAALGDDAIATAFHALAHRVNEKLPVGAR